MIYLTLGVAWSERTEKKLGGMNLYRHYNIAGLFYSDVYRYHEYACRKCSNLLYE